MNYIEAFKKYGLETCRQAHSRWTRGDALASCIAKDTGWTRIQVLEQIDAWVEYLKPDPIDVYVVFFESGIPRVFKDEARAKELIRNLNRQNPDRLLTMAKCKLEGCD